MKKTHRFLVDQKVVAGPMRLTDGSLVHQLVDVLKLGSGERMVLFDAEGQEAVCIIKGFSKKEVLADCVLSGRPVSRPRPTTLYCSILKRENFELVVQKAAEIGISRIVPLVCRRTVKLGLKKERLEKIAREAIEQSGGTLPPEISDPMKFLDAVKDASSNGLNIFLEVESRESTFNILSSGPNSGPISIFVGPEGGWDRNESEAAIDAGLVAGSLGNRVLRAETAAIISSFLVVNKPS